MSGYAPPSRSDLAVPRIALVSIAIAWTPVGMPSTSAYRSPPESGLVSANPSLTISFIHANSSRLSASLIADFVARLDRPLLLLT